MFTPRELALERGWPGRVDGDRVVQLAAQTLQSYFSGGSVAREHAEYPLEAVLLRAPVLEPPSIRLFEDVGRFAFANPAAVVSPGSAVQRPAGRLDAAVRLAAVIGAGGHIAAWTGLVEWRAPELPAPKDRDFALLLGPLADTQPEDSFEWSAAVAFAAAGTRLRPGDLLGGPVVELCEDVRPGPFSVEIGTLGRLHATVA